MATLLQCFTYTDQHLNEVEEGREPIYRSWSGSIVLSSGKEASYSGIGVQDFISHHLFSFRGSVQDYKIHMDMEIVKFAQEI